MCYSGIVCYQWTWGCGFILGHGFTSVGVTPYKEEEGMTGALSGVVVRAS